MARPRKAQYYRAKESFATSDGLSVSRGELASADYKNRPGGDELWEPVSDRDFVRFFQEDEKATAAPGEKRGAKGGDDVDA